MAEVNALKGGKGFRKNPKGGDENGATNGGKTGDGNGGKGGPAFFNGSCNICNKFGHTAKCCKLNRNNPKGGGTGHHGGQSGQ